MIPLAPCDHDDCGPTGCKRGHGTVAQIVRLDLRTRAGREAECLNQIRKAGGFSVFWATEFLTRAHALERLQQSGRIKVRSKAFPWIAAKVRKPNTPEHRTEDRR